MNRGPSAMRSRSPMSLLSKLLLLTLLSVTPTLLGACGGGDGEQVEGTNQTIPTETSTDSNTSTDTAALGSQAGTEPLVATDPSTSTTSAPIPTTTTTTAVPSTTASSTTTTVDPTLDPSELIRAEGEGVVVGSGDVHTFSIDVERATGFEPSAEAAIVESVLTDPRSWPAVRNIAFQRTGGDARLIVIIATPPTVDALCAPLRTNGYFSCRRERRVILNSVRWTEATPGWASSLTEYRQYLVNHEVGHYLGLGHVGCPAAGAPAPVMMQQTKTIGSCSPNSWPAP